jgi:hypothetical protein
LERISNLENLLRKHTGAEIETRREGEGQLASPILSPPLKTRQSFQLSPESIFSEGSSQQTYSEPNLSNRVGVLSTSLNGNVRYEPKSSQWTSVLANTHLSIGTPALEEQEEYNVGFEFPLSTSASPCRDELLSILPPMQQCDYLKRKYFTVFSPVGPEFLILYPLLTVT